MTRPDILCIGSVLWDIIGRTPASMTVGSDVPGRIARIPGGVALNIAMTLRRLGLTPAVLSAVGCDAAGNELIAACEALGIVTDFIYRAGGLPTDRYMAIEGAGGLIAAIADAHSLEAAGDEILTALGDGRLGTLALPYGGMIALDGNLTVGVLAQIARDPLFGAADLRVAPASPGKAGRLAGLFAHPRATFYVNLEEAGLLTQAVFTDAATAATALISRGAHRVLVTNGAGAVAEAGPHGVLTAMPPAVTVARITGAGDTFMAAHMAADLTGAAAQDALLAALNAAADYISKGSA